MRTVRNRYSRTPARTSYHLRTEVASIPPNVSKAFNKVLTRMIKDGDTLDKIARSIVNALAKSGSHALAQEVEDDLNEVLYRLERLDLDF